LEPILEDSPRSLLSYPNPKYRGLSSTLIRQDFSNDLWLSFYLHALINH
jgi:hypothetical protein